MKVTFAFLSLAALTLTSGLFTVLLYDRFTGSGRTESVVATALAASPPAAATRPIPAQAAAPPPEQPKPSAKLDAPVIKQYPELPSGCEVTSLAMLLQYAGISKTKLELADEMKKDETPIRFDGKGGIAYWGNPHTGFVGDVTGKSRGFGIYHEALLPLLQTYIPGAVDLTGKPFELLQKQVEQGFPVIVWNTIDYAMPAKWVEWDSPAGRVKTTFAEHAVLLVGYDEQNVYVNDPILGEKGTAIDKAQFLATWEAMGKQALSYHK
ncbi:hypothetical protein SD70_09110 [Gordoniibacillus kamchatkensis]|uniref:Peptidase C39-like domain-containing protein n=2 Tax=Gordoniibacillus kamchatkensis TaxID=1590651 RepID=A0ABR5AJI5_9BACL|nr:hypothetical protein SD70_09110 [Paenibacillus sp. VKM B-2647]